MKKHEVILAGYSGKMIVFLPDTTKGTSGSGFHEPEVLSRYNIPPRSAEVLWDLAKKKKVPVMRNRVNSEITNNITPYDMFNFRKGLYQERLNRATDVLKK